MVAWGKYKGNVISHMNVARFFLFMFISGNNIYTTTTLPKVIDNPKCCPIRRRHRLLLEMCNEIVEQSKLPKTFQVKQRPFQHTIIMMSAIWQEVMSLAEDVFSGEAHFNK